MRLAIFQMTQHFHNLKDDDDSTKFYLDLGSDSDKYDEVYHETYTAQIKPGTYNAQMKVEYPVWLI